MGLMDAIKKGSGLSYLEKDKADKGPQPIKVKKIAQPIDEKFLHKLESDIKIAIEKLQDVQEKLRVRRSIE